MRKWLTVVVNGLLGCFLIFNELTSKPFKVFLFEKRHRRIKVAKINNPYCIKKCCKG